MTLPGVLVLGLMVGCSKDSGSSSGGGLLGGGGNLTGTWSDNADVAFSLNGNLMTFFYHNFREANIPPSVVTVQSNGTFSYSGLSVQGASIVVVGTVTDSGASGTFTAGPSSVPWTATKVSNTEKGMLYSRFYSVLGGYGDVTSTPAGIDTSIGTQQYMGLFDIGSQVTLTMTIQSGSNPTWTGLGFVPVPGCPTGSATCIVTIGPSQNVNFTVLNSI